MNVTSKRIGVIAGAAALLVLAIWYLALMSPQSHKLAADHRATAAANQQAAQLETQAAQLKALEVKLPQDRAKLTKYQQAITDTPELANAIDQVQSAADRTGVALNSFGPGSAQAGASAAPGGPSIAITMSAAGNYAQLMSFITALDSMQRTLVINNLNISGTGQKLSAQISSNIFYTGKPTP